jgi:hypothetical protein
MVLTEEIVKLVLGTGLVSAFITALFSKFQADKNHKVENITKERKEWRDCIRLIVLDVVQAYQKKDSDQLQSLEAELRVHLNPYNKRSNSDIKIISAIRDLRKDDVSEDKLTEFCDRVSYLLKHDWERVKKETASGISILNLLLASLFCTVILSVTVTLINIPVNLFISCGLFIGLLVALLCVNYLKSRLEPNYDGTFKLSNLFSFIKK